MEPERGFEPWSARYKATALPFELSSIDLFTPSILLQICVIPSSSWLCLDTLIIISFHFKDKKFQSHCSTFVWSLFNIFHLIAIVDCWLMNIITFLWYHLIFCAILFYLFIHLQCIIISNKTFCSSFLQSLSVLSFLSIDIIFVDQAWIS